MSARHKHATIAEVAKRAGVAKSTASLAFTSPERLRFQTLERVKQAAREIGYAPNAAAQSLKTGRNNLIGVIISDMRNPHNSAFVAGVQGAALERGHFAIAGLSDDDSERETKLLNRFNSLRIRGIVLMPSRDSEDYARRIAGTGALMVIYDQKIEGLDCDHVGLDNVLATSILTRHLIGLGHRRIGHVAGCRSMWSARQRLDGYAGTMREAGISVDPAWVADGEYNRDLSYQAAIRLMRGPTPPTALVTANNDTTIGTMLALRTLGLDCPRDVSLASVDTIANNELITPQVTAVSQPVEDLARLCTEWLFDRLDAEPGAALPPREVILAPKLIMGTSTRRID